MKNKIETVYILENPEKNLVKFATSYQLRYDDTIKEVFGVACLNDLYMMLQFNKSFQEAICKSSGISEKSITLDKIIRVASKEELTQLREELLEEIKNSGGTTIDNKIPCPFDPVIQLREGIFQWDDKNSYYYSIKKGA